MVKPQSFSESQSARPPNQSGPLPELNLFETDSPLRLAVAREGGGWARDALREFGRIVGSHDTLKLADDANRFLPELRSFDRFGQRIDVVEYHPAYHQLMRMALRHRVHSVAWTAEQGGHVVHTALEYMFAQIEGGVCCPVTMAYAAVPALRTSPSVSEGWLPKLLVADYDNRFVPASQKQAMTIGMAMTEKQGGSDLRANETTAAALAETGWYGLQGHKWFCSAPMSDAFLTLALNKDGLSCFLVPRWRPDGTRNPFLIQRLKNKLGNRSNASSEIEYRDTWGQLIGEPGRGIGTIMTMVKHTRLDTCLAPVAMMRQALVNAVHHAMHRSAFGRPLIDQPLMRAVLADLAVELEAAVMLLFRVARAFDDTVDEASEAFSRLLVAVAKFYLNKLAPSFLCECMEVLGGGGYVEDCILPRLYREAPLNGIWEGSGNVVCLDVLRTLSRTPSVLQRFSEEVLDANSRNNCLKEQLQAVESLLASASGRDDLERHARYVSEKMAQLMQASMMFEFADNAAADYFFHTRFANSSVRCYGAQGRRKCPVIALDQIVRELGG